MNTVIYRKPDLKNLLMVQSIPYGTPETTACSAVIDGTVLSNVHIIRNRSHNDQSFYLYRSGTHAGHVAFTLNDDEHTTNPVITFAEHGKVKEPDAYIVLAVPQNTSFKSCDLTLNDRATAMIGVPTEKAAVRLSGTDAHFYVPHPNERGHMIDELSLITARGFRSTAAVSARATYIFSAPESTLRADIDKADEVIVHMTELNSIVVTNGKIGTCPVVKFGNGHNKGDNTHYTHVGWIEARRNPVVPDSTKPENENPRFSFIPMPPYRPEQKAQIDWTNYDNK